jgi:hypothetical protein
MKTIRIFQNVAFITIILATLLITQAQGYAKIEKPESNAFSKEELVQMLSPIALYPDSLLAQVLMASTYPLEIVESERWLRKNEGLKGDELNNALQEKDWDTSVKSLCHFPDVLFALSEKIDQTRKLGDAFLSQEDEVMSTVQELRDRAYSQGNLKTTREQKIIVERKIIRIEPAATHVVYVPVYDPLYVYGPWRCHAFPPYYWYYPPGYAVRISYIRFGPPVFIGMGWFSWAWFDWPSFHICIVWHNASRYHKPCCRKDYDHPHWRHNPHHRKGVDYRDRETRERFEQKPPRVMPAEPEKYVFSRPKEKVESPHIQIEHRAADSSYTKYEKRESPGKLLKDSPPDKPAMVISDKYIDRKITTNEKEKSPDGGIKFSRSSITVTEPSEKITHHREKPSDRGPSERGKDKEDFHQVIHDMHRNNK